MSNVAVTIAKAVKDALNGNAFTEAFTASRTQLPEFKLADMKTLHVTVVPRSDASEALTRKQDEHMIGVDVAVQQRFGPSEMDDNVKIDALLSLVQEIADFLNRLAMGDAIWKATENDPVYAPEQLRELRQFTSVLKLTYRLIRTPA